MSSDQDGCTFLNLLKNQASWANVCTEPGMVAFLTSKAASLLDEPVLELKIGLSGGILKNALSAGLPHTSEKGPKVAAAAGAVACRPEQGLTILGNLSKEEMERALEMVRAGKVSVEWDDHKGVYGVCIARSENHRSCIKIDGAHTNVVFESLDGQPLASSGDGADSSRQPDPESVPGLSVLKGWSFNRMVSAILSIEPSDLEWLLEGARSCYDLARSRSDSGGLENNGALSPLDLVATSSKAYGAISARMSGVPWPVLTSAGSGNQGLMISIPLMSLFETMDVTDETKARALAIAHGVNMLTKAYTGEVSPSCGGISAGAGLAAAVCWLQEGTSSSMADAATRVLAALSGMICDGAKESCALKGSMAVMAGLTFGTGEMPFDREIKDQGVVGQCFDETLLRLEALNRNVLSESDAVLLELSGVKKG